MEMSKGEFAQHVNLSAARISQMIADGTIGGDALVGEGRNARINVEVATRQISTRRDPGQSLGNGLKARLDGAPKPPSLVDREPETAELIQLERLEAERRRNRQAERDEAIAEGKLVPADELAAQVRKVARDTVELFTGMAPDLANAISAKYELPARDLQHLIVEVMNAKRAAAAKQIETAAAELPATTEAVLA
jgi:hypothetical protein